MKPKAPPYLRQSLAHRDRDSLRVVVGCWNTAQGFADRKTPVALLPPGDPINAYDWTLAAHFIPPAIIHHSGPLAAMDWHLTQQLAQTLIHSGCRRVLACHPDGHGGQRWLHPKEAHHAA